MTVLPNSPGLHVPEPRRRPGEDADWPGFGIPPAGAVRRPPVNADAGQIRDLAFDLIRVLDDQAEAVGEWTPAIDDALLLKGLRAMMLTCVYDIRMVRAQRQGK